MIGYFFGLSTRQQIKEGLLQNTIGGIPLEIVKEKGKEFARKKIRAKLKPEAMRKLQWHQNQGHRCILVSANLDVYLEPWSQMEKLQETLCSILQVDDNGRITGFLKGKNCRGEEKTKRLLALLGDRKSFILYAYGDSKGDKEMLEIADFPFYRKFD
jgi:HAD superfamily hydrolase (TIGR01490 family)